MFVNKDDSACISSVTLLEMRQHSRLCCQSICRNLTILYSNESHFPRTGVWITKGNINRYKTVHSCEPKAATSSSNHKRNKRTLNVNMTSKIKRYEGRKCSTYSRSHCVLWGKTSVDKEYKSPTPYFATQKIHLYFWRITYKMCYFILKPALSTPFKFYSAEQAKIVERKKATFNKYDHFW